MASNYQFSTLSGAAQKVASRTGVNILPVTDALWFGFCIQEALDMRMTDDFADNYMFSFWAAEKENQCISVKAYAHTWKLPCCQLAEAQGMGLIDDHNPLYRLARHGWTTQIEFLTVADTGLIGRKSLDLKYTLHVVPDFYEEDAKEWLDEPDHMIVFQCKRFALPQF